MSNPYASKTRPNIYDSAPVTEESNGAPAEEEIPSGSIKELLEWVGDDRERAQKALEAEEAGSGRKTLISALQDRLDG